ncbi:hypothetical protein CV658_04755 [Borreliella burgdorferi]|nr:hypothetical protein CV682_04360 [Borreliella burgdorferi]PRR02270.1 hypothetical protein CV665_04650 [Borreliella burgdorferi]PRR03455.1 hypothetical protein CV669_04360 [Borreliella burgdorferi]PRR07165.1 hypothetical protein CV675_04850 [Borreliella burgdorferi]PRR08355.1 hypothetical protein CV677_04845 [Borreliella burgdorferi]
MQGYLYCQNFYNILTKKVVYLKLSLRLLKNRKLLKKNDKYCTIFFPKGERRTKSKLLLLFLNQRL